MTSVEAKSEVTRVNVGLRRKKSNRAFPPMLWLRQKPGERWLVLTRHQADQQNMWVADKQALFRQSHTQELDKGKRARRLATRKLHPAWAGHPNDDVEDGGLQALQSLLGDGQRIHHQQPKYKQTLQYPYPRKQVRHQEQSYKRYMEFGC